MSDEYTIEVQDARAVLQDDEFVAKWDQLLKRHRQPASVYASPSWVGHVTCRDDNPCRVWSVRDASQDLVGIVPVRVAKFELQFSVANRVLMRGRLSAARLLGGTPILPDCQHTISRLLRGIFSEWPECDAVYSDSVPVDSYFCQSLRRKTALPKACYLYVVDGPRPWHQLKLYSSFDAYLKTMSSKARANLRREVRKLQAIAEDQLVVSRFTNEEDIDAFLRGAAEVSQHTWQGKMLGSQIRADQETCDHFKDLARRSLLRSYLLNAGERPCAFVIGYQHYGVYCYATIGFDEDLAEYSPGKVLLFKIIEDLHTSNPPEVLDFGVGDAAYKRRFGTHSKSDLSLLLMRKNVVNRLLTTSHSLFTGSVEAVKRIVGRKVTK